ncbi:MAG: 30S ribosomal protein S17 [Verrucomicrobia bacterium RIFCSPLOWO2_12_FULL_64_8]|nr:MAG: 30S ribosomal protein S17 [Verrucomicrobia bacterium RIFCSPLOWO2_12_FULL_64_8]
MSTTRHKRKTFVGFVTSRMGDKSVKVTVPYKTPHPRYQKVINRQTVVHAHDEKNEAKVGDKVEVMETRPLSHLKRWRVLRIVESARTAVAQAISEQDVAQTVPTKATPAAATSEAPSASASP